MRDQPNHDRNFHRPDASHWHGALADHMMSPSQGATMLASTGIGLEDLAWIHRDQFVHYLTVARATNDPSDWPSFRRAVLDALTAAFGFGRDESGLDAALDVIDHARHAHDPARDWDAFLAQLWLRRRSMRPDLA